MRTIPPSELLVNDDGSVYHLHLRPEDLADTVILVGDPGRVAMVAAHFDTRDKEVSNREFHTITGCRLCTDDFPVNFIEGYQREPGSGQTAFCSALFLKTAIKTAS